MHLHLNRITEIFKEEMKENLIGIHLHGSLAMGCFQHGRSDIDLLVVSAGICPLHVSRKIADRLIEVEKALPSSTGIEVSIVLEEHLRHFVYPTPFEFHYSPHHRDRYAADRGYVCRGGGDPDLAAHCTVTWHRGIALYGQPYRELYPSVDRRYYVDSIIRDIGNAAEEIVANPVYYALNLCRVLYYLREGIVASKKEGGEWGTHALPTPYCNMSAQCLRIYEGYEERGSLDIRHLKDFARYMLDEIGRNM